MSEQTKAAILLKLQEIADIMRDEMPGEDYLSLYIARYDWPQYGVRKLVIDATNTKKGDARIEIRHETETNEEYDEWAKGGAA